MSDGAPPVLAYMHGKTGKKICSSLWWCFLQ